MEYTVYLRTNSVNGKQYVGQTNNFERREKDWHKINTAYANKHIDGDRIKYGVDAFTHQILATCSNRQDAWELEKKFINEYNTKYPSGYNLSDGGAGGFTGIKHSDETKNKMSNSQKLENHPNWGKHLSEDVRKKIAATLSKTVYQYTLNGELVKVWSSAKECGRNGFNQTKVCACCNGKRNKHKGYKWSYNPM